jgi:hypothetical protein
LKYGIVIEEVSNLENSIQKDKWELKKIKEEGIKM